MLRRLPGAHHLCPLQMIPPVQTQRRFLQRGAENQVSFHLIHKNIFIRELLFSVSEIRYTVFLSYENNWNELNNYFFMLHSACSYSGNGDAALITLVEVAHVWMSLEPSMGQLVALQPPLCPTVPVPTHTPWLVPAPGPPCPPVSPMIPVSPVSPAPEAARAEPGCGAELLLQVLPLTNPSEVFGR